MLIMKGPYKYLSKQVDCVGENVRIVAEEDYLLLKEDGTQSIVEGILIE